MVHNLDHWTYWATTDQLRVQGCTWRFGYRPQIHFLYRDAMDTGTIKTPIPKCRLYWCFCLGWCGNFVGSKSGQKQSVKLLQNMVYNTTQHPPPTPQQPHTVCIILYVYVRMGGMGGGGQREGRVATVYRRGRKYQHDWLYISSL
jgi:hypothetical protein